jgi:hypothetical protein
MTMAFFDHTASWFKGEIFEAGMLLLFGAMLVLMAAYFWKFGHSVTGRALIIPFLVVGLFWAVAGGIGIYRNTVRVEQFRVEYQKDTAAFVESEKQRVEGFLWWYRYLLIGWSVLILAGLAMFMLWGGNHGRAVGVVVILFGVAGLLVDHTSEHNARSYYSEINKALNE